MDALAVGESNLPPPLRKPDGQDGSATDDNVSGETNKFQRAIAAWRGSFMDFPHSLWPF